MGTRRRSVLDRRPLAYAIAADIAGEIWYPTEGVTTFEAAYLETPLADPIESDWKAGSFEITPSGTVRGLVMVGPAGAVELERGTWYEWVRIDDPQTGARPVEMVGVVIVQ